MQQGLPLAKLNELICAASADELAVLESELEGDSRKGVHKALERRRAQLQRERNEENRVAALYEFDASYAASGLAVGLDEVGRGALAGPLAVGAVVLPSEPHIAFLNDSKQLTPQRRTEVAAVIEKVALAAVVAFVPPERIDEVGMSAALRIAFGDALAKVEQQGVHADVVLVDGNPLRIDPREKNVVKGDAKSASIAAASILAKVTRDNYMASQDSTYPLYGFSTNKGYGSEQHIEAIRAQGLSPFHRKSFCRSFAQESLF